MQPQPAHPPAPNPLTLRADPAGAALWPPCWRELADSTAMPARLTDASGDCIHANDAWAIRSGRPKADALASGWTRGVSPQDLSAYTASLRSALSSRQPFRAEYHLRDAAGEDARIVEQAIPVHTPDGLFLGFYSTCSEPDAPARLDRQLREQTRLVEQLLASLDRSRAEADEFASVVSHDLKEPLRGIHNFVSFVLEDAADRLDAQSISRLNVVQRLAQRAESLLNGMHRAAQIGRIDLRLCTVDLGSLAAEVVRNLGPMLEMHHARVELAPAMGQAWCDPAAISEVIANLVLNAAKFNDRQQRLVSVSSGPDRSSARLVVMVDDNGIGIAERHRELVFRMFKRLHPRDRYGGGIGAGLAISRRIVERHGGTMWMEPSETGGTRACFTLPRAQGLVNDGNQVSHPDR
jgi:signal transduction histidine kinase